MKKLIQRFKTNFIDYKNTTDWNLVSVWFTIFCIASQIDGWNIKGVLVVIVLFVFMTVYAWIRTKYLIKEESEHGKQ